MALSDGSPLTRRRVLRWAGALGLALVVPGCSDDDASEQSAAGTTTAPTTTAGTTSPDCVLTPELTEGPYYLDLDLMRRDITEGRPGLACDLVVNRWWTAPAPPPSGRSFPAGTRAGRPHPSEGHSGRAELDGTTVLR